MSIQNNPLTPNLLPLTTRIMNYELFIARRYLFAKKSHHAINIISGISVLGVARWQWWSR